ncbi:MAG: ABC transporter permease [Owenweeksia sp.]
MKQENVLKKIGKDPLGAGGMLIILLAFFVSVFAYFLIPDNSPFANEMHLSLANRNPGFEVKMLKIPVGGVEKTGFIEQLIYGSPPQFRVIPVEHYQPGENEIVYSEYTGDSEEGVQKSVSVKEFQPQGFDEAKHIVNRTYFLGTDKYGRDLLSRILLGARVSFAVGFISVLISLIIGIPMGAIAGYYGGWIDKVVMWFINVVWSIPTLLMVIAITLALGKGFWQVFIAVGFTMWVEVARIVRGQVLGIREKEYVQAAKVLGYGDRQIIFRHILPNALAPVIVISAANFAAAILIESGLSFLGIGAQPPMPSWGGMIKDHYAYLIVDKAYLAIAPGMAIMLLVLSFMMLGNALRDALDVRRV